MVELVYVLCAATSVICAAMLWRGWRTSAARLLLWTALGFVGLAINNVVLLLDETVFRDGPDLQGLRHWSGLVAVAVLLFGLIWDNGVER